VATELEILKGSRVIDRALASPAWRELGVGQSRDRLVPNVTFLSQGQIIAITMKDYSPKVASTGVQALLDAYSQLHTESEIERFKGELDSIAGDLAASTNKLSAQANQMRTMFAKYPGFETYSLEDLPGLFAQRLSNASAADFKLREVQGQIQAAESLYGSGPSTATQPSATARPMEASADGTVSDAVIGQIARSDNQMAHYLARKQDLEDYLSRTSLAPNNPAVKSAQEDRAAIDREIQRFAHQYIAAERQAATAGVEGGATEIGQLRLVEATYDQELKKANADIESITQLRRDVSELQEQITEEEENHRKLQAQYDVIERESRKPNPVRVIQNPEPAALPSSDNRPPMAAGLGIAGTLFALACVLALGLAERRLSEPDDTVRYAKLGRPILGMLPELPDGTDDIHLVTRASDCIHHIRTSLQLWYGWIERPVIVISGPSSGAGKTTLTLGLGLSYAVANSRTLLIDFDLTGGGLSRRAQIIKRDRLGRILREQGKIQLAQLKAGLEMAAESGMKLGEALVKLNFVAESDLSEALLRQSEKTLGVLDAMEGAKLARCVTETEVANLSILGIGNASAIDAGRVGPAGVQQLLDECRKKYDVVLIDTGLLPGNLEAAVVAAAADGVILTVSRGELRNKLSQSIEYAARIGCRVAGVVYNRATSRHLNGSLGGSSGASRQRSRAGRDGEGQTSDRFGLFGKSLIVPIVPPNGAGHKNPSANGH
jgi:Mrp family chromosome partitioning ATPase